MIENTAITNSAQSIITLIKNLNSPDNILRRSAQHKLQSSMQQKQFAQNFLAYIQIETDLSFRLYATIILKKYILQNSSGLSWNCIHLLLEYFFNEMNVAIQDKMREILSFAFKKKLSCNQNLDLFFTMLGEQPHQVTQLKAYSLAGWTVANIGNENRRTSNCLRFFTKVIFTILPKFSKLRGRCMGYASNIFTIMAEYHQSLRLPPSSLIECVKTVYLADLNKDDKYYCLKNWYKQIILVMQKSRLSKQDFTQILNFSLKYMENFQEPSQNIPQSYLILVMQTFRLAYSRLKALLGESNKDPYSQKNRSDCQKLIGWLFNVLQNSRLTDDELRVEIGHSLRVFWADVDHEEISSMIKGSMNLLGLLTYDPILIRRKISVYYVLTSCFDMLKETINYGDLIVNVICKLELENISDGQMLHIGLSLINQFLNYSRYLQSKTIADVIYETVTKLLLIRNDYILLTCCNILMQLGRYPYAEIKSIATIIIDAMFVFEDNNQLLELVQNIEKMPIWQWTNLGLQVRNRILERLWSNWESIKADRQFWEILSRLISILHRSLQFPYQHHPLFQRIPSCFIQIFQNGQSLLQSSLALFARLLNFILPKQTVLAILPKLPSIISNFENCYKSCCQILLKLAANESFVNAVEQTVFKCLQFYFSKEYDTQLEGNMLPVIQVLSIIRRQNFPIGIITSFVTNKIIEKTEVANLMMRIILRTGNMEFLKNNFFINMATFQFKQLDICDFNVLLMYINLVLEGNSSQEVLMTQELSKLSIQQQQNVIALHIHQVRAQIEEEFNKNKPQLWLLHWIFRRQGKHPQHNNQLLKVSDNDQLFIKVLK